MESALLQQSIESIPGAQVQRAAPRMRDNQGHNMATGRPQMVAHIVEMGYGGHDFYPVSSGRVALAFSSSPKILLFYSYLS